MLTDRLTSSSTDEWATPQDLFDTINAGYYWRMKNNGNDEEK